MRLEQIGDCYNIMDSDEMLGWCKKNGNRMEIGGMPIPYTDEKHQRLVDFLREQGYVVSTAFTHYQYQVK